MLVEAGHNSVKIVQAFDFSDKVFVLRLCKAPSNEVEARARNSASRGRFDETWIRLLDRPRHKASFVLGGHV